MVTRYTLLTALTLCCALGTGCSQQTIHSANSDISHDVGTAGQALKKVGDAAKPQIQKLDAETKPQLDKLDLGARVTAALRANANLPDSIRVDASDTGVRLRGTVQNADQKSLAGRIAQQTVPAGKTVQNQLAVKA